MSRVAVTGRTNLYGELVERVRLELRDVLTDLAADGPLTGVSLLDEGTDVLFAEELLAVGGSLVAVLPSVEHRDDLPDSHWDRYDRLVASASAVIRVSPPDFVASSRALLLDGADHLVAVWDGGPMAGRGRTRGIVDEARRREIPVHVLWPDVPWWKSRSATVVGTWDGPGASIDRDPTVEHEETFDAEPTLRTVGSTVVLDDGRLGTIVSGRLDHWTAHDLDELGAPWADPFWSAVYRVAPADED